MTTHKNLEKTIQECSGRKKSTEKFCHLKKKIYASKQKYYLFIHKFLILSLLIPIKLTKKFVIHQTFILYQRNFKELATKFPNPEKFPFRTYP